MLKETCFIFVPGSSFGAEHGAGHYSSVFLRPPEMTDETINRLEGFMTKHQ